MNNQKPGVAAPGFLLGVNTHSFNRLLLTYKTIIAYSLCLFKYSQLTKQLSRDMLPFTGFDEKEVKEYIQTRLKSINCRVDIFTEESYHTFYTLMNNTSVRILNHLINKNLILVMSRNKSVIDSEIIIDANKELMLG